MTLAEAVQAAGRRLVGAGIAPDEAARDAELLARHARGWDRATYLARRRDPADEAWLRMFEPLVSRRSRREPIAYIRGVQEFWGREFLVSPAVLIPRPETELIVEEAIAWLHDWRRGRSQAAVIVDVGTGSGCLAVTIAAECPEVTVVATDISSSALAVAKTNAVRHGVRDRITFVEGRYLDPIAGPVDLVVANPPYVAERETASLQPEVVAYEPDTALFGGEDGLRDVLMLIEQAGRRLSSEGAMLLEIGAGQEDEVRRAADGVGTLSVARMRRDLQGIPRTAVIERA